MMTNFSDTICAPATVAGTGAIAIIRISGEKALEITDRVVRFKSGTALKAKGYTVKRGMVFDGSKELIDDVLAAVFHAPKSYTGEDSTEIYCHSSRYIISRILERLLSEGCRMAEAGEFTRRAFVNGKMDLAQAEAVADVIASSSRAQHRVAMTQLRGGYSARLSALRSKLVEITSLMELELDFSEEDLEFADRTQLSRLLDAAIKQCGELADSFKAGNAIKNGIPVAIVGEPNSGKSTLLNALLGEERAIVSDIPGTTRDTLEECITIDGMLFRFSDTAGLRDSDDKIEKMGIERALQKLSEAEIVLWVIDSSVTEAGPDSTVGSEAKADTGSYAFPKSQIQEGCKVIALFNKSDLEGARNTSLQIVDKEKDIFAELSISAKTGSGMEELKKTLSKAAAERMKAFGKEGGDDPVLVTNLRHAEALRCTLGDLRNVRLGLNASVPSDLLSEDLRSAIRHIGEITGEVTTDEVLGEIFSRFCIGK